MYHYICKKCGKPFEDKHDKMQYCSKKCACEAKRMPEGICPYCGKTFRRRRKTQKYCSCECTVKAKSLRTVVECENCGKKISATPAVMKKNTYHFCSIECYRKQQSNLTKGKLTHGGIYHHGEYIFLYQEHKKYKEQHRLVMEEYLGRKLNSNEIVHHIDGNKANNDISNLQIVTRAEHINIHRDELHKARGIGNYKKKSEVDL